MPLVGIVLGCWRCVCRRCVIVRLAAVRLGRRTLRMVWKGPMGVGQERGVDETYVRLVFRGGPENSVARKS